jgi:hypothetical protein
MPDPRPRRASPWRWPAAWALALGFLAAVVFLVPAAWIQWFFSPLDLERGSRAEPRPWLVLVPPPEVLPAAPMDEPQKRPPAPAPTPPPADWWTAAWRVRVADDVAAGTAAASEDSDRIVLDALGLPTDLAMIVRPDSVMAARLLLMQREDSFRFDELKPYLSAMTRAAAYRDLQSRVADMYDDFLRQDIMVTPRRDP